MDFEEIKKNAVAMFGNAIRKSSASPANAQHAAMALGQLLDQVGEGDPVPLDPLYDFMKEQDYDDKSLREIMFFFHSRREMLNLDLRLPQPLADLPEEQRNQIALDMARQTTDGYMVKKKPDGGPALPGVPDPGPGAYAKKKKKGGGDTKRLAAMLGLLVVLGGVAAYVYLGNADQAARNVKLTPEQNTVGCARIVGTPPHGVCYLTPEAAARPAEELARAAAETRDTLNDLGYTNVRIMTPDGKRL